MNILKFYKTLKGNALHSFGLFKSSCELEPKECKALHMIPEPVVFEAIDSDLWQYSNVIVAYKGLGYIVYIYELDTPNIGDALHDISSCNINAIRDHDGTILCEVPNIGSLLTFLSMLYNTSVRFGSLKPHSCVDPCCG